MPPKIFCKEALDELAPISRNEAWVRGAHALCEMYAATDARYFERILRHMALGTAGSALTEGANWLLKRWQLSQLGQAPGA